MGGTQELLSLDLEVLHPTLVNFDVAATHNYAVKKGEWLGGAALAREKVQIQ